MRLAIMSEIIKGMPVDPARFGIASVFPLPYHRFRGGKKLRKRQAEHSRRLQKALDQQAAPQERR